LADARPYATTPVSETIRSVMRTIWTLLAIGLALTTAASASAARAPSAKERSAISEAVRFFPTIGRSNTVAVSRIRVATVDGEYSLEDAVVRSGSGERLREIHAVLRRAAGAWQVLVLDVYRDRPRCLKVPSAVRTDLLGTKACPH